MSTQYESLQLASLYPDAFNVPAPDTPAETAKKKRTRLQALAFFGGMAAAVLAALLILVAVGGRDIAQVDLPLRHPASAPQVAQHEPHSALFAGPDGLDDYRRIAPQLPALIAPGGMAAIEIGYDQGQSVSALLRAQGLGVSLRRDLAGHDRCLVATLGD
mgnify:CR=1 FL=1